MMNALKKLINLILINKNKLYFKYLIYWVYKNYEYYFNLISFGILNMKYINMKY